MKPTADVIRRMLPPWVTGRAARLDKPKHWRTRVVQFDPPTAELTARAPRKGRWWGSVFAPALGIHGPPGIAGLDPAAGRASRGLLNAFPRVLAVVPHRHIDGRHNRVSETSATGLSDTARVGKPAYPPWPHSVCLPEGLAGGCAPSDPQHRNGAP